MSKHPSKALELWLAAIGAKGGSKKTKAQTEARKANAKKAREARRRFAAAQKQGEGES